MLLTVSNPIQRLTLYNKTSLHKPRYPNAAAKSIGVIFANTASLDKVYPEEIYNSKLESTKKLFEEVLEIEDVRVHINLSKDEIIE